MHSSRSRSRKARANRRSGLHSARDPLVLAIAAAAAAFAAWAAAAVPACRAARVDPVTVLRTE
jgi:ABC-type antimicrobial peptide transport system permease subunit